MSRIVRSAARHPRAEGRQTTCRLVTAAMSVDPFWALVTAARRAFVLLRFAASSTTAADWRRWTEVHTPRKTQPG